MFDYDARGERATRDVVSRGIYAEMRKSNSSPNGGVYISMSHLGPDKVRQLFPGMVKRCADSGFDLAAGKVEVVPTAHYFMGGVVVDIDTKTRMPGLYVAGEDAGGAHGSNRLAEMVWQIPRYMAGLPVMLWAGMRSLWAPCGIQMKVSCKTRLTGRVVPLPTRGGI